MFTPIPNSSLLQAGGDQEEFTNGWRWTSSGDRIAPISAGTPSDGKKPRRQPAIGDAVKVPALRLLRGPLPR